MEEALSHLKYIEAYLKSYDKEGYGLEAGIEPDISSGMDRNCPFWSRRKSKILIAYLLSYHLPYLAQHDSTTLLIFKLV